MSYVGSDLATLRPWGPLKVIQLRVSVIKEL
jgi:hypothetical protein